MKTIVYKKEDGVFVSRETETKETQVCSPIQIALFLNSHKRNFFGYTTK